MSSARVTPVVEIPIARLVEGNVVDVNENERAIVVDNNDVAIVITSGNVSVTENHQSYTVKQYVCCCSETAHLGLTVATVCGYIMSIIMYANYRGVQDGTTALLAVVGIAHVSGMVWLKCTRTYDVRVPVSPSGGGGGKVYHVNFSFEVDEKFKPTEPTFQVILFNGKDFTLEAEAKTLEQIQKNKTYTMVGFESDDIEKFKKSIKGKKFSAKLSNGNIIVHKGVGGKRRRRRSLQKNKRKRNKKTRRKYNTLSKN